MPIPFEALLGDLREAINTSRSKQSVSLFQHCANVAYYAAEMAKRIESLAFPLHKDIDLSPVKESLGSLLLAIIYHSADALSSNFDSLPDLQLLEKLP